MPLCCYMEYMTVLLASPLILAADVTVQYRVISVVLYCAISDEAVSLQLPQTPGYPVHMYPSHQ
jgi:hypothetical protein